MPPNSQYAPKVCLAATYFDRTSPLVPNVGRKSHYRSFQRREDLISRLKTASKAWTPTTHFAPGGPLELIVGVLRQMARN